MRCQEVRQRISAFLDQELTPLEYREVEEHLTACSRCREEYRKLALVKAMAQKLGRATPRAVPSVEFSLERATRALRLRRIVLVALLLLGFCVAVLFLLGWQRSLLDEQILNPDHFAALGEDVLSRTKVRVETLELVTSEYR